MAPRILSVVDTREYEEVGDRWVLIPGSGNPRECDRCGRLHEVHATVECPDGRVAVVGTGCMGLGAEVARKVAARASRAARLSAEIEALKRRISAAREAWAGAEALKQPHVYIGEKPGYGPAVFCGDQWMGLKFTAEHDIADVARQVVQRWRRARAEELFGGHLKPEKSLLSELNALEDALDKLQGAG